LPISGKGLLFPLQREILFCLGTLPDISYFYLAGGTALAEFYLGHRRSFDLDIFTAEKGLVRAFSHQTVASLQTIGLQVEVVRQFEPFAEIVCLDRGEGTKIHFALDSPFRLAPPVASEFGISILGFDDLAADKLLAFTGRMEPRDAVDLFFLLQLQSFPVISQNARKKDPGFDLYWFAAACAKVQEYPDDLHRWPVEMVLPLDVLVLKKLLKQLGEEALTAIHN
jgi:hypothetical protein